MRTGARTRTERPVVLFDWGETLMWIPGMVHDPDRHLACVEAIYEAEIVPVLRAQGARLPAASFIEHYREACRRQMARSKETQREHTFTDRFALAFSLAGIEAPAGRTAFERMADALGRQVAHGARLLEHAAEVVEALARVCLLGVVSNYPHGPVVGATLERFGLRQHFSTIVVSCYTGWMKPHPDCYRPALAALAAVPDRTLMVGDDLTNDIKGAKALGLRTAWLAPRAEKLDPDVDIHLKDLSELPGHCRRLFL